MNMTPRSRSYDKVPLERYERRLKRAKLSTQGPSISATAEDEAKENDSSGLHVAPGVDVFCYIFYSLVHKII